MPQEPSSPGAPPAAVAPGSEGAGKIDPADRNQILVIATRIKGQVDSPHAPILTLDTAEIQSYGASSISDLIAALSPQTGSGRGRGGGQPVILLNGQRIANFRELRNFSPEAIKRVEVLPEEVALRYGFPPNQRVINFILKDNYASRAIELDYRQPWAGGSSQWEVEGSLLRIAGPNRFNLVVSGGDTTPLTEAERPIIQPAGSRPTLATDPVPAAARTLIANSSEFDLNLSWARGLGEGGKDGSLSFSGGMAVDRALSQSGLDLVRLTAPDGSTALRSLPDPLDRFDRTASMYGSANLNRTFGKWQLTATVDGSHSINESLVDRQADTSALVTAAADGRLAINGPLPAVVSAGFDRTEARTDSLNSLVTLVGRPLRLPAGEVATTLRAGYSHLASETADSRAGGSSVNLQRGEFSAGLNVGIPLTSRRDGVLGAVGDITLNLSAGISDLSDFGAVRDWNAGLTWGLTGKLSFQASYVVNQAAPGLGLLAAPVTRTLNVPVYDFSRGETVLVTVTGGGNRLLREEEQRDFKLSVNWQIPFLSGSNLIAEYFDNRSSDLSVGFPLLTPAIEAAFPDRVTRDPGGRLIAVDRRPITLAQQRSERIRWGFNLSGTVGSAGPGMGPGLSGGGPAVGRPGAGRPGAGPSGAGQAGAAPRGPGGGGLPGMMAMFGGGGPGRWNIALFHTYRIKDTVLIGPSGSLLNLLDGDALSGGGAARHSLELDAGIFHKGFGARISGRYSAPTRIRASGLPGSSDLDFSGLVGLDFRAFVVLDQQAALIKAAPFLKGSRFALRIDNVLGTRQRVTDGSGEVPLSYQPDYLDPRGRYVAVEWRKQF